MKCKTCGNEFEPNGYSNSCPDCRRRKTPKFYFIIGWSIIILGFIAGIIAGSTYREVTINYQTNLNNTLAYSYDDDDDDDDYSSIYDDNDDEYSNSDYSSNNDNSDKGKFNAGLMFTIWFSTVLVGIIPLGIGSILYRLNLIIDKKRK